jgi:hypothetical protein
MASKTRANDAGLNLPAASKILKRAYLARVPPLAPRHAKRRKGGFSWEVLIQLTDCRLQLSSKRDLDCFNGHPIDSDAVH